MKLRRILCLPLAFVPAVTAAFEPELGAGETLEARATSTRR